jgi:malonate decarboxylase gamma subunit
MMRSSKLELCLRDLFGGDWHVTKHGELIVGEGALDNERVALIGSSDGAAIGVDLAHAFSGAVLDIVETQPGRPILLLIDNSGQKLSKRDELLGNSFYLAHLAECLDAARACGHRVIALVYAGAVSGGFMATAMAADECFALVGAEIKVMRLDAMARITKIGRERLEELCENSPIFQPTAAAFERLGAIAAIWEDNPRDRLRNALMETYAGDRRDSLGRDRGGRSLAATVAERVLSA